MTDYKRVLLHLVDVRRSVYGVPCRHLANDVSAGDLMGIAEVKNIMPAVMPAKSGHDAFLRSGRKLRFQF